MKQHVRLIRNFSKGYPILAPAGGGAASSAFLRQIGVAEVNTLPELLEALVRLVNAPHPSSPADCLTEKGYLEDRAEYDSALT